MIKYNNILVLNCTALHLKIEKKKISKAWYTHAHLCKYAFKNRRNKFAICHSNNMLIRIICSIIQSFVLAIIYCLRKFLRGSNTPAYLTPSLQMTHSLRKESCSHSWRKMLYSIIRKLSLYYNIKGLVCCEKKELLHKWFSRVGELFWV